MPPCLCQGQLNSLLINQTRRSTDHQPHPDKWVWKWPWGASEKPSCSSWVRPKGAHLAQQRMRCPPCHCGAKLQLGHNRSTTTMQMYSKGLRSSSPMNVWVKSGSEQGDDLCCKGSPQAGAEGNSRPLLGPPPKTILPQAFPPSSITQLTRVGLVITDDPEILVAAACTPSVGLTRLPAFSSGSPFG